MRLLLEHLLLGWSIETGQMSVYLIPTVYQMI